MVECEAEQKKAQEAAKKRDADTEAITRKKSELYDCEVKEQQLQRQLKSANEKLERLQRHQTAKRDSTTSKIASLKEQHERLSQDRADAQLRSDENERVAKTMEAKTAQLQKKMDVELSQLGVDYNNLLSSFDAYCNEIQDAIR